MSETKVCKQPYLHHKSLTQDGCSVCRMEERVGELNSNHEKLRQYIRELVEEIEFFRDQIWADSGESDTWSYGFRSGKDSAAHRILNRLRGILDAK